MRPSLFDAGKSKPGGVRRRHLMTTDLVSSRPTAALTDKRSTLSDDRDGLRCAVANQRLQHPRGQLPKTDGACADQPNPGNELGGTSLATKRETGYQYRDGVLGAGHQISLAARR